MIEAWHDRYGTWHHNAEVKVEAGIDVELMLAEGVAAAREKRRERRSRSAGAERRTLRDASEAPRRHREDLPRSASAAGFSAEVACRRRARADP